MTATNHPYTVAELEEPEVFVASGSFEWPRTVGDALVRLGCENRLAAERDFEAYGVCKFAAWTWFRCGGGSFRAFTVRAA